MSSPTPQSPRFADQPSNADHRLKSGTVVMIVIACIVAAVAATAAVVFTGPEQPAELPTGIEINPTGKPQAAPYQDVLAPKHASFDGVQGFTSGAGTLPFPKRPPIGGLPLEAFEFGIGLQLQIPNGWDVIDKNADTLAVGASDAPALCIITAGKVQGRDIMKVLQTDLKGLSKQLNNFETDTSSAEVKDVDGTNFKQIVLVPYRGEFSGSKGTVALVGMAIELFNADTGLSAFIDYSAADVDTLKAKADDVDSMINSMI